MSEADLFQPEEIVVTAAIVGAELTREKTPHLPITPEEIAAEAKRCHDAGAAVIHLHVRDEQGQSTQQAKYFQAAVDAIRACCDVVVQVSTGGAVGMSDDERLGALASKPEMATLNCGTINFGEDVFVNAMPTIRHFAKRIVAEGIVPEIELYELGHLETAMRLLDEGLIAEPLHVQWVLGIPGAMPARAEILRFAVSLLPKRCTWSVAAVGRFEMPMAKLAAENGGFIRVGLEDNIYLRKGELAQGSAPLVEEAVKLALSAGRKPVSAGRARHIFDCVRR